MLIAGGVAWKAEVVLCECRCGWMCELMVREKMDSRPSEEWFLIVFSRGPRVHIRGQSDRPPSHRCYSFFFRTLVLLLFSKGENSNGCSSLETLVAFFDIPRFGVLTDKHP